MNLEHQQETKWCWAAVAKSIHEFLQEPPGAWTQAKIATKVLLLEGQILEGVDCSLTPGVCNYEAYLEHALDITGNLRTILANQHLFYSSVKNWVNAKLPVAARIVWWGGGGHFIVLDGYREFASGAQQVHVQDPLYGPSFQYYDDLVNDYPPGGAWQDTYLTK